MPIPTGSFSIIPLKNTVIFPGVTQALKVGRDKSIRAVDMAQKKNNWVLTLAQKNPESQVENVDDLHEVGTLAKIESVRGNHETGYYVVIRGYHRVKVNAFKPETDVFEAYVANIDDVSDVDKTTEKALLASLKQISNEVLKLLPGNTDSAQEMVDAIDDLSLLTHMAAANADIEMQAKQKLLETANLRERVMSLLTLLHSYKENLSVQQDIRQKLSSKLGQTQRDSILREQLRTIKEELGEKSEQNLADTFRQKIAELGLAGEALELA
ncbi:MAG: LON peptidase substrate-binding domain-containing protein [Pseudobdellovibrio sp.]